MKFAKELEQDLVPEWRAKYLDYKQGKKKVKAIVRAINRANATPLPPKAPNLAPQDTSIYGSTSPFDIRARSNTRRHDQDVEDLIDPMSPSSGPPKSDSHLDSQEHREDTSNRINRTPQIPIPQRRNPPVDDQSQIQYGSFVPTPPSGNPTSFELPGPAVSTETPLQSPLENRPAFVSGRQSSRSKSQHPAAANRSASMSGTANAYEIGQTTPPPHKKSYASLRQAKNSKHESQSLRPFIKRIFSMNSPHAGADAGKLDVDMAVLDQVRLREKEFLWWMDKELDKVETFYKSKEDEAGVRLKVLREQLHEMRNRRIEELARLQQDKTNREQTERAIFDFSNGGLDIKKNDNGQLPKPRDQLNAWLDPLERALEGAKAKTMGPREGSNSRALQSMRTSPELRAKSEPNQKHNRDGGRDYVRRPHNEHEVPYRTAKRKLKLALQEFYRSMELAKSYALLNRTAFRKINKKYDKAVDAHPPLRYMTEKVNRAWFVQSDVLDGHLHAVEDLYARYFERGNHKVATGKLRGSASKTGDRSASAFRNGLLLGTGAVFTIQGIVYGSQLLFHEDPTIKTQTNYLLQIYAGYFFGLYLFAWFCLDCSIWTRNKINYAFVFEFDPRNNLDWRQLSEFPSFLILVFGLFVWLNFSRYGDGVMYIYYPIILVFVTVVLIFLPAPLFFPKSRKWFIYSHWRLLLAGLYPVEFRDFFLGDMYCSLTYSMANIELFFCLYATYWNNPAQCNSQHSRLLGFFTALPSIWRGLQCVRRYYDTRNFFPHLVNCGKYSMSIMYYVTLSLYRINRSRSMLALFCTFAAINAIYSAVWDLLMDWSLLQPDAKKRYLRDVRGFKPAWWYYTAMILDPILRCNWIFYAIYTHDLQHNSIVSFLVGFSEITRRGIWTLFRVENEHCANVAHFKASRDIPLPYHLETDYADSLAQEDARPSGEAVLSPQLTRQRTTGALEAQDSPSGASLRRRPNANRTFTKIVANAHTQDFEKKRKPATNDGRRSENKIDPIDSDEEGKGVSSDDDDDEPDAQDFFEANELIRKQTRDNLSQRRDI